MAGSKWIGSDPDPAAWIQILIHAWLDRIQLSDESIVFMNQVNRHLNLEIYGTGRKLSI